MVLGNDLVQSLLTRCGGYPRPGSKGWRAPAETINKHAGRQPSPDLDKVWKQQIGQFDLCGHQEWIIYSSQIMLEQSSTRKSYSEGMDKMIPISCYNIAGGL